MLVELREKAFNRTNTRNAKASVLESQLELQECVGFARTPDPKSQPFGNKLSSIDSRKKLRIDEEKRKADSEGRSREKDDSHGSRAECGGHAKLGRSESVIRHWKRGRQ